MLIGFMGPVGTPKIATAICLASITDCLVMPSPRQKAVEAFGNEITGPYQNLMETVMHVNQVFQIKSATNHHVMTSTPLDSLVRAPLRLRIEEHERLVKLAMQEYNLLFIYPPKDNAQSDIQKRFKATVDYCEKWGLDFAFLEQPDPESNAAFLSIALGVI